MSTWYTAHYGNWRQGNVVTRIGCSLSRKEIFAKAQQAANETGETVTIDAQTGGPNGLRHRFFKVEPQQEVTEA